MGPALHLSFAASMWVQAAYLLAMAVLLIPLGRLADQGDRLRFYLAGIAVFTLGSLAAALSANGTALVLARILQGVGRRPAQRHLHRHRHRGLPARGARPRAGDQRHGGLPGPERGPAPGRAAGGPPGLALDLPGQPAGGGRRLRLGLAPARAPDPGAAADPGRRGPAGRGPAGGVPGLPHRPAHLLHRMGLARAGDLGAAGPGAAGAGGLPPGGGPGGGAPGGPGPAPAQPPVRLGQPGRPAQLLRPLRHQRAHRGPAAAGRGPPGADHGLDHAGPAAHAGRPEPGGGPAERPDRVARPGHRRHGDRGRRAWCSWP